MDSIPSNFRVQINEHTFSKNPESSELGRKIIAGSIDLIDEVGFEAFTFRKLGKAIESTEASIYRYFESKHKLLLYLTSWYWAWMEYKLAFGLANITSPEERLERAVIILTETIEKDSEFMHVDEVKLNRIVISEASKSYLNKNVDLVNKEGVFTSYKQLVARVSDIILEINPGFKYPHMLVSTVIEGAHLQRYFAEHLKKLTDDLDGEDSIQEFYKQLVFCTLQSKTKSGKS